MKKSCMLLLFVLPMLISSHYALAQQVTITLNPGWTWVSYPRADTMDLTTALASIPPSEGDVIKTQTSASLYMNGQWYGGLQRLVPGKGLMYKSMKDTDVSFIIGSNPEIPAGAINGLFTINVENEQVYFSQGNLQYQASTNTWRFAEHQYDRIGAYNANISEYYTGYIDLFGWGTSGYNHGAVYYQPWSTSNAVVGYGAYGVGGNNLNDNTGIADWGYNSISNGGSQTNHWRTLTHDEWVYLFETRTTESGIRFAKARVNGIGGVVLLPDNWNTITYELNNPNGGTYESNVITPSDWEVLEQNGAVFLPACGVREGITWSENNSGKYWSSSSYLYYPGWTPNSYYLNFNSEGCYTSSYDERFYGMAVRLVYSPTSAYLLPAITTDSITSITDTMAVGCGYVMSDGGLTVTERGFCWSTNHNPTVNDSHALSGTGTGAFAVEMIGLMANTTYYVRAYAINNAGTSYGTEESFTTLESVGSDVPEGAINGLFSVDANRQVYFSQGNLQYRATTDTWQFAANQYDYVGSNNQYISSDFGGWIDLFGYGTSGCYPRYPWLSSTNPNSYSNYPYYGDIANTDYDWGAYNPISNGGNEAGLWRTLTKSEWVYLLVIRANASEKYSYAVIDGTAGIVLLPDNYTIPNGIFFNPNANNQYSVSEWQLMELNGAVFLPKAGSRTGTNVGGFNTDGYYWTSTGYEDQYNYHAYALFGTTPTYSCYKYVGCSVRLVQDYNP